MSRPKDKHPSSSQSPRRLFFQSSSISATEKLRKLQSAHIPTRIDKNNSISECSPRPLRNTASVFDEDTHTWKSMVLPRHHPDRREDVKYLDAWITDRLASVATSCPSHEESSWVSENAKIAEEQLKIMDVGFSELIRQVAIQCTDRAELMDRLWRSSHELYNTLLLEMSSVIDSLRYNAADWKEKCELTQKQMDLQRWRHEKEMKKQAAASKTNKSEDSQVYREMQEELFMREKDMRLMENTLADLSVWFPNFQSYSNSVLRKHLPPIEDALSAMSSYEQCTDAGVILPQDLLFKDMKRIQKLDIGIAVSITDENASLASPSRSRTVSNAISKGVSMDEFDMSLPHQSPATHTGDDNKELPIRSKNKHESTSFRALVVENQLQNVVMEELQNKHGALLAKCAEEEATWRKRVDALLIENSRLRERLEGQSTVDVLQKLPPILQPQGFDSVSHEILSIFHGKKQYGSTVANPPNTILSVSDIQKVVLQFCLYFLSNRTPLCWHVHKGMKNDGGRDVTSSPDSWLVTGLCGGIRGAELKIMSFEAMFSKFLVQQLGAIRPAREILRKIVWSILIWSQSQLRNGTEANVSRFDSVIEALPRSLLEHEKGMVKSFVRLFGLSSSGQSNESDSAVSGDRDSTTAFQPQSSLDEVFLHIFMRCFSAMQRYIKCSHKAPGVTSAAATNLFSTGTSCPVPASEIERILSRVFTVSVAEEPYKPIGKRRVSVCVAAAAISAGEKVDLKAELTDPSYPGESWWSHLPEKIFSRMKEEVVLSILKNAGEYTEAFDIILTVWSHIHNYYLALRQLLEEIFKFLNSATGGPIEPMFNTLLLSMLEKKSVVLSSQHKVLSMELIQLYAEGKLNPQSFAETILSKTDILLSGLHIVFDAGPRSKRHMKREGEVLLTNLTQNYLHFDPLEYCEYSHSQNNIHMQQSDEQAVDASNCVDAVLSHADLCFGKSQKNRDENGILAEFEDRYNISPDVFMSLNSMRCLSELNIATRSACPLSYINSEVKGYRHHMLVLMRRTFVAWTIYTDQRRDCSDSEDEANTDSKDILRSTVESSDDTTPIAPETIVVRRKGNIAETFL
mmetsp:Transcript_2683/g.4032  ORF Transcript_2683/g.4032 Transcript_2683/m.4032 type:complete len:1083 (-) Transcript_2683:88-3336(-)